MKRRPTFFTVLGAATLLLFSSLSLSQSLDPAQILKPLADSWPTYSGD